MFDEFENRVMLEIINEVPQYAPNLLRQYMSSKVIHRTFTERREYIDFEISAVDASLGYGVNLVFGDVQAKLNYMEHNVGFLLFVHNGYITCLEGYVYEEPWPERITRYEILPMDKRDENMKMNKQNNQIMFENLEHQIMLEILKEEHKYKQKLLLQYESSKIVRRSYTGHGFFTYYEVPSSDSILGDDVNLQLGDVQAKLNDMKQGVGFLLFVRNGRIACLEGYAYDEPWPDAITKFEVIPTISSRSE